LPIAAPWAGTDNQMRGALTRTAWSKPGWRLRAMSNACRLVAEGCGKDMSGAGLASGLTCAPAKVPHACPGAHAPNLLIMSLPES